MGERNRRKREKKKENHKNKNNFIYRETQQKKNNFVKIYKNLAYTDLKTILLNYQNN